jgi:hypothetical protein
MKARVRIIVAALALPVFGGPLLAQEAPPPPQNDVVGNPQLQDFSLNGTVTQPSTAPAPVQQQPQSRPPATTTSGQAQPPRQAEPQSSASVRESARQPAPSRESASSDVDRTSRPEDTATPALSNPISTGPIAPASDLSDSAANVAPPVVPNSGGHLPILPWIVAALALAAAAGWYFFFRQHPRESYAGAGNFDAFEASAPAPAAAPPAPAPKPAAPVSEPTSGIVSTRLRPWLEIEFTPERVIVEADKVALNFRLSLFNSGSAPARAILLEASLFNAGPQQDVQIRGFFENPKAEGNRIATIAPLQRFSINTAVTLPRDQVSPLLIEGRPLLVPMIGFNVLYSWGSGKGQSSASYLVGKQTGGEKLAPFRLDVGARMFRGLVAREHELRVRS